MSKKNSTSTPRKSYVLPRFNVDEYAAARDQVLNQSSSRGARRGGANAPPVFVFPSPPPPGTRSSPRRRRSSNTNDPELNVSMSDVGPRTPLLAPAQGFRTPPSTRHVAYASPPSAPASPEYDSDVFEDSFNDSRDNAPFNSSQQYGDYEAAETSSNASSEGSELDVSMSHLTPRRRRANRPANLRLISGNVTPPRIQTPYPGELRFENGVPVVRDANENIFDEEAYRREAAAELERQRQELEEEQEELDEEFRALEARIRAFNVQFDYYRNERHPSQLDRDRNRRH